MTTVITYGTFDLFHIGHLNLLRRLHGLGDKLIVAVSTDEFNERKGKYSVVPFADRFEILSSIKFVDQVIPEHSWEQKVSDVMKYNVNIFAIGDDWQGKFDDLKSICQVVYMPRTEGISTSLLKKTISSFQNGIFLN